MEEGSILQKFKIIFLTYTRVIIKMLRERDSVFLSQNSKFLSWVELYLPKGKKIMD